MLSNTDYDHTRLNAPDLVRSRKLSNLGIGWYLDGWPPRNTNCHRQNMIFNIYLNVIIFK